VRVMHFSRIRKTEPGAPNQLSGALAPPDYCLSAEDTLIFFGWTASRFGMTISSTP
jgi:hypothetical protein